MWGIIAITQTGLSLARQLKSLFPESVIYTLPKWGDDGAELIEGDLKTFAGALFARHRTLVFVMATGIVVRSIARYLVDKTTDPAVVVIDEKGQFVISLLSGHLGGANAVATQIAEKLHAVPVITTASDVQGLPSVDMIAQACHLHIESMDDAKTITAMAVNGHAIVFRNDSLLSLPPYFVSRNDAEGLVVVSHCMQLNETLPYARLIPQNIIIGVGCRRGVSGSLIIDFITEQLTHYNIHPRSIRQLASIDLKSDEVGIHQAAMHFGVDAVFVPSHQIKEIEMQFTPSAFVKSHVGVSGVCEPAAFIAGGSKGAFICRKQSKQGVTLAIFEGNKTAASP
jgi:cobalt-precorrin 5A hydrolase